MTRKEGGESLADMFAAFGRNLKIPSMDVDTVVEHHRRNLESVQRSIAAGASGASAMARKQQEMLRAQMEEIGSAARSYTPGTQPHEVWANYAQTVQRSFERAVKDVGEIGEIMQKSGAESAAVLRERIEEAMQEIRTAVERGRDGG